MSKHLSFEKIQKELLDKHYQFKVDDNSIIILGDNFSIVIEGCITSNIKGYYAFDKYKSNKHKIINKDTVNEETFENAYNHIKSKYLSNLYKLEYDETYCTVDGFLLYLSDIIHYLSNKGVYISIPAINLIQNIFVKFFFKTFNIANSKTRFIVKYNPNKGVVLFKGVNGDCLIELMVTTYNCNIKSITET